jgi:hypothetical protein
VDALGDDRRLNYRLEALYRVADAATRHAMLNRLI